MDGKYCSRKIMTELPGTGKITLMTFSGGYRWLTGLGCVLSGISAVLGLFPYLCMWNVIRETVIGWPGGFNGDRLVRLGWLAVAYSLLSMLVYFAA